jgi:hypothetical protein
VPVVQLVELVCGDPFISEQKFRVGEGQPDKQNQEKHKDMDTITPENRYYCIRCPNSVHAYQDISSGFDKSSEITGL